MDYCTPSTPVHSIPLENNGMQTGADQGARGRTKPIGLAGTEPARLKVISTPFSPVQLRTWRQIYRQDYSDLVFEEIAYEFLPGS